MPPRSELPFDTAGEAMGFIIHRAFNLLHHHHIAHNDIKWNSNMINSAPVYRKSMHLSSTAILSTGSATHAGLQPSIPSSTHYFIDFELSRQYDPEAGSAREMTGYGGDKSVPEYEFEVSYAVHIYRLGNLIRTFLISNQFWQNLSDAKDLQYNHSLDFMSELVADMIQDDPAKRLSIDESSGSF
ncbi:hypothetical protein D9758_003498 [Tetrapyrgos nigripes]|uniref:Protein kinase domain-containing protein n=1 Tax=Tetrapyrgos nigripes TaxID=182062 RepID=A0A8H5LW65_9AGAR|nr:hypothetical protein D9758_003498 [Tetrapyrgos nigripes]